MGQKEKADPVKQIADHLRSKHGVPYRTAKLEKGEDSERVEFFRGKDFLRYFREDPTRMPSTLVQKSPNIEDQVVDLGSLLIRKGLISKTDRKFKRPKPGKEKLVKFPRTLETLKDQNWTVDAFYCWNYERPSSPWLIVGSFLMVVGVVGFTLFPLAPYIVRMYFVYALVGLFSAILALISVRYVVFGLVWVFTGCAFWIFPNLLSDEASVVEAFLPVVTFKTPDKGQHHFLARFLTLAAVASLVYVMIVFSPDKETLKQNAQDMHDSVLDLLVYGQMKKAQLNADGFNGTTNSTRKDEL